MDALTAGLFVAASFAASAYSNKNQAKIEEASINMQVSQNKLQAADTAYQRTKQFRESISANLALSGMGFGGVSGFRGVAAKETEDYFADMATIEAGNLFANAQATGARASSRANRFARDLNAAGDAAQLASQLGLFQGTSAKRKPSSFGGRAAGKVK